MENRACACVSVCHILFTPAKGHNVYPLPPHPDLRRSHPHLVIIVVVSTHRHRQSGAGAARIKFERARCSYLITTRPHTHTTGDHAGTRRQTVRYRSGRPNTIIFSRIFIIHCEPSGQAGSGWRRKLCLVIRHTELTSFVLITYAGHIYEPAGTQNTNTHTHKCPLRTAVHYPPLMDIVVSRETTFGAQSPTT